ncbi:MAG TPA: hypothetical protein VFH45_04715, partial [Acidimicrobiales bacterium]|nr:hypothetical protein [Acidimicrobiales bacterium]
EPRQFLSRLCGTGALAAVDAVGDHPYSYPVPPDYAASWNAWQQMSNTPVSLRSVMEGCGAGNKQIWVTEYGAPTNGPGTASTVGSYNLAARPDHVSEQLQSVMATQSVDDAKASPWMGALFWYSARDRGTLRTTNQNFFGLRRYDGTAKPAWAAMRSAIAAG